MRRLLSYILPDCGFQRVRGSRVVGRRNGWVMPGIVAAVILVQGGVLPRTAMAEMTRDQRADIVSEALDAFEEGNRLSKARPDEAAAAHHRAVELFELLIADGVHNGKLYYDLGNAYLQLGDLGRAILNYRRAEELIGSDPQLQANLRYARSLRRNQIERSGEKQFLRTVFFWHYDTSIGSRFAVALAAYVLFWLLLAGRTFNRRRPGLAQTAAVMLLIWLTAGTSVAIETYNDRTTRAGVTVKSDIIVRKGNGEAYEPQFQEALHEGVEFVVLESRPGWYKIELPDGNTGWIRQSEAALI